MLGRWEWAEYIAEGLVVLGCLGELVADLGEKWLGERRSKRLERWSTIVLILALTVSLTALVRTNELSGFVIGSLGDKAEEADRKAKSAIEDADEAQTLAQQASDTAGSAKTTADAATSRVAMVSTKAAQIDGHLTWVEYILSARFVQDEDGLRDELKKDFKESHIAFRSYFGDEEAFWLCRQLAQIADKAGVEPRFECGMEPPVMVPITGLSIKAPTIEETEHLGMILVRPRRVALPGLTINSGIGPLTIFVGTKASVRLWWPKAETQPTQKETNSKQSAK